MSRVTKMLDGIDGRLAESMGVRKPEDDAQRFAQTNAQDIGRRPLPEVAKIEITQVIPDPDQPRVAFSEDALQSLANSIRERGQLSPILVRWSDTHQKWVIIAGERRWQATKHAGLKTINCQCQTERFSNSEILEQQLIENCLREDLTVLEEARAFRKLANLNGWNGKQVAESLRVSQTRVSRALSILRLPDDLVAEVEAGVLTARAAYEVSKLPTVSAQRKLAKLIAEQAMSVSQTSNTVRQRQGKTRKRRNRHGKLTFQSDCGTIRLIISHSAATNYAMIDEFVSVVLDEVRHRCRNNVSL